MTPDNVQVAIPEEPRASEPVEPEERTTALVRWEDRPQGWQVLLSLAKLNVIVDRLKRRGLVS